MIHKKQKEEEQSNNSAFAGIELTNQDDMEDVVPLENDDAFLPKSENPQGETNDLQTSNFQYTNRELWFHKILSIALKNWTKDEIPVIRCSFIPHEIVCKALRLDIDELMFNPGTPSPLFENPWMIKFIKFFSFTLVFITLTHKFIRLIDFEYDKGFNLSDFFRHDFYPVVLDMIVFFFIGRLFRRRGVDRLYPCLIPMMIGCILPSCINEWKIFQYSFSMFEIKCRWPFQLFLACVIGLILVLLLIFFHVRTFYSQGVLLSRVMELIIILLVFLLPNVNDKNFHPHHWYIAWLLGMFANADTRWSIATSCFAWGYYINGIAVYGRDPILGCAYSLYLSIGLKCKYIGCLFDQPNTTDATVFKRFIPPDWRECKEGYYALYGSNETLN
jgi:hypothetical protein